MLNLWRKLTLWLSIRQLKRAERQLDQLRYRLWGQRDD